MSKCIARINVITTILIFLLIILIFINTVYLRPQFGSSKFLSIIVGSLPNFVGSFVLYILILSVYIKKIVVNKEIDSIKYLLIMYGVLVFVFLTIEEYFPFFTGNKTFDVYDIIANIIGVLTAYVFFVFKTKKCLKKAAL